MTEEQKSVWYDRLIKIAAVESSPQRYDQLVQLHKETLALYIPAIQTLSKEQAWKTSSDGRQIALVVAHIMAWEDFQIQAFTDPNRAERLSEQMHLRGFEDRESHKRLNFTGVDDFNAYQTKKYTSWPWEKIQERAIGVAKNLQNIFSANPSAEFLDFLNSTPERKWKILPDKTITIPGGWYLWMVSLEHEAVEHAKDLGY